MIATTTSSSASSIPDYILPWLSIMLILFCLWCVGELIVRIRREGVDKFTLSLIVLLFSTVIFIGYGAQAMREILGTQEFFSAVFGVIEDDADEDDVDEAVSNARSDEQVAMAIALYGQQNPEGALDYIEKHEQKLPPAVDRLRPRLQGTVDALAARDELITSTPDVPGVASVTVRSIAEFERLLGMSRTDADVRIALRDGKFDLSALDDRELRAALKDKHVKLDGNRVLPIPRGER